MTFPASLAIGNITRLRNLEYMFVAVLSSALPPLSFRPKGGICCSTPPFSSRASSAASFPAWRGAGRGLPFFFGRAAGGWGGGAFPPEQPRRAHPRPCTLPLAPPPLHHPTLR